MKRKTWKRWYQVPDGYGNIVNRANKTAAGMTATSARSNQFERMSRDAQSLTVRGTLDKLGGIHWAVKTRTITRYTISDHGRAKLARMIAKRNNPLKSPGAGETL